MTITIVLRDVKTVEGTAVDTLLNNKKIVDIVPPGTGIGENIIDYQHKVFISSGWIDMHVHAFPEFDPYGDVIDEVGFKTGVTTIIDAGSTGANRLPDLVDSCKSAKTNVFAFLNISQIGLHRIDELANLNWLNEEKLKETIVEYKNFIIGLKARMSNSVVGPNGIEPLKIARKFSSDAGFTTNGTYRIRTAAP